MDVMLYSTRQFLNDSQNSQTTNFPCFTAAPATFINFNSKPVLEWNGGSGSGKAIFIPKN